jgi:hypothetical protein
LVPGFEYWRNFPFFGAPYTSGTVPIFHNEQGDQIGRIFAPWVIVYFGGFFENCIFGSHVSMVKVLYKICQKSMLDHILGDFFTISSGHPDNEHEPELAILSSNVNYT